MAVSLLFIIAISSRLLPLHRVCSGCLATACTSRLMRVLCVCCGSFLLAGGRKQLQCVSLEASPRRAAPRVLASSLREIPISHEFQRDNLCIIVYLKMLMSAL